MTARVAEACTAVACAHLLVRGDRIEFVSAEHLRRVGGFKELKDGQKPPAGWVPVENEKGFVYWSPPSDIRLPTNYVLVHDAAGAVFPRCELFVVRWRGRGGSPRVDSEDMKYAREYYGERTRIVRGSVDVPSGPWKRIASVRAVRYRRQSIPDHLRAPGENKTRELEHAFKSVAMPSTVLYSTRGPLAWKLSLPNGCIIDDRGFIVP